MAKWADYCISAVRYNAAGTHIDKLVVHIHDDVNSKMGPGQEMTRAAAVDLLEKKKTFVTILFRDGSWHKGAPVNVFPVTVNYIKTTADKSAADNLENLKRF